MSSFKIKRHAVFQGKTELFRDPATALGVILKFEIQPHSKYEPPIAIRRAHIFVSEFMMMQSHCLEILAVIHEHRGCVYTHIHTHTDVKPFVYAFITLHIFWIYFIETNYLLRPNPLDQKFAHKQ